MMTTTLHPIFSIANPCVSGNRAIVNSGEDQPQTVTTHELVELLSLGWRWADATHHLIDPHGRLWSARCLPDHRYDIRPAQTEPAFA